MQKTGRPDSTHYNCILCAHAAKIAIVRFDRRSKYPFPIDTAHQILSTHAVIFSNFATYTYGMKLDAQTTQKLAELSKLEFNEEELKGIQNDLEQMIAFVEKLNEINTDGVQPLTHISEDENQLREDLVKDSIDITTALKNAPAAKDRFFTVPKVIKK